MQPDDFEIRLAAAINAGVVPAEMFDEIASRRAAAEKILSDYFNALGDPALTEFWRRVLEE